jgi:signal transduction histidine kinase
MNRRTFSRAITIRVIALAAAVWLAAVMLTTVAVAKNYISQIKHLPSVYGFTEYIGRDEPLHGQIQDLPGAMEAKTIQKLGLPYLYLRTEPMFPFELQQIPNNTDASQWLWDKWAMFYGFDYAIVYQGNYDTTGEWGIIMTSGNRICFPYVEAENWQGSTQDPQGYAWVNLDAIAGAAKTLEPYLGYHPPTNSVLNAQESLPVLRLTGWFEGNQFHPVTMERGWYAEDPQTLHWETLVDTNYTTDHPLLTIYGWDVDGMIGNYRRPVVYGGIEYDSLTDCIIHSPDEYVYTDHKNLWEYTFTYYNFGYDSYGFYTYNVAIRCWPIPYAILRLLPAYLVFTGVVVLAVFLILRRIRRNLILPLRQINTALKNHSPIPTSECWAEPQLLQQNFTEIRRNLDASRAENDSLSAALEDSREAEELRKGLISNLAHELKTPLAVIHSYSEGLLVGIAPEKREQYIQTILDETNRMDTMVKQMLDVSHLDAGNVTLNTQPFSLGAMIRSVTEKFQPMIAEKRLNLQLAVDDTQINGDVSRIDQVITNFMSNAVKYTPAGGQILVKSAQESFGVRFSITNTAPHLSDEALNRVYDSFYRADTARTEKSTGLGLAIVKSIMSLHGYRCYVLNSLLDGAQAVEFGFYPNE